MLSIDELAKKIGQKVLFIGIESFTWGLADYVKAAQNARAMGFDTIAPKQADGENRWYKGTADLAARRRAVLEQGVGFLPFTYSYGPRFGNVQIANEAAIAKEIASVCDGLVAVDMEVEWNGQQAAAAFFKECMQGFAGDLIISTWADPVQQGWDGVLKELDPIVSAWGPQQYSNWLDSQENQFKDAGINLAKIFPAIDIADLYAGNNPAEVLADAVKRGHKSYWIWEYSAALKNANLIKSLVRLFPKMAAEVSVDAAAPQPVPASKLTGHPVENNPQTSTVTLPNADHSHVAYAQYTISSGDSLSGIADKLHVANWYQDLYVPNKVLLDSVAQAHGQKNSDQGNAIWPGTVIKYPIIVSVGA